MMSKVLIFNEIYENDFDSSVLEMISMLSDLNIDSKDIIVAALGDDLYSKESILQNIPVGKVVGYKNIDTNQLQRELLINYYLKKLLYLKLQLGKIWLQD
jgi:hypothetical protein